MIAHWIVTGIRTDSGLIIARAERPVAIVDRKDAEFAEQAAMFACKQNGWQFCRVEAKQRDADKRRLDDKESDYYPRKRRIDERYFDDKGDQWEFIDRQWKMTHRRPKRTDPQVLTRRGKQREIESFLAIKKYLHDPAVIAEIDNRVAKLREELGDSE